MINEFFEELDAYLNRLKILEGSIPDIPELKTALARVLKSVLVLCGISAKYVKKKRFVKCFRNLVKGTDDELSTAYKDFHKAAEQEAGAIRNATLAGVEHLVREGSVIHADIVENLAIAGRTEESTAAVLSNTVRIDQQLQSQTVSSLALYPSIG